MRVFYIHREQLSPQTDHAITLRWLGVGSSGGGWCLKTTALGSGSRRQSYRHHVPGQKGTYITTVWHHYTLVGSPLCQPQSCMLQLRVAADFQLAADKDGGPQSRGR